MAIQKKIHNSHKDKTAQNSVKFTSIWPLNIFTSTLYIESFIELQKLSLKDI